MLKFSYDSQDSIPKEHLAFYVQDGTRFILNVDGGVVPKAEHEETKKKVDEFRVNNRKLYSENENYAKQIKELEGLKTGYDESLNKLAELEKQLASKEKVDIDSVVEERVSRLKADLTNQINTAQTALKERNADIDKYKSHIAELKINNRIQLELNRLGTAVQPGAVDDIIAKGRRTFFLENTDGEPVAKDAEGKTILGKDAMTPLSIREWIDELPQNSPYFFKPSQGSGALGSTGNNTSGTLTADALSKMSAVDRLNYARNMKK